MTPLVVHDRPEAIVAWRADGAVTRRRFLAEVAQLVALFPAGGHLLNLCRDRYRFSVGLAAAIVAGKVSLLPPADTPVVQRQLKAFAPDLFCLTDSEPDGGDLPRLRYPAMEQDEPAPDGPVPQIDCRQTVAVLFTSGSTGTPQAHGKTWGAMVGSMRAEAARLGLRPGRSCAIVGTVPPQHMYGFESTVLLAWQSGSALCHGRPFYPADIAAALAAVPAPRLLVSTPVHLRALREAGLSLPELDAVLSATAPLSVGLAHDIEALCQAPLNEIYGSTETGLIATRRTTQGAPWHLLPGVELRVDGDRASARGAHLEHAIALNDVVELRDDRHFLLHGRLADLINIAGKRHSLAALNHLLNAIPGVLDGAFYMPDEADPEQVTRLAACAVAPGLGAAELLAALRRAIDPIFLPRPLLLVDRLPRNAAGKLPRAELQALFATAGTRHGAMTRAVQWTVPLDHPSFAGHFPGNPMLPGALLLDAALHALAAATGMALERCTLASVKFLSPAGPGDRLLIAYATSPGGALRFEIVGGGAERRKIASGSLIAESNA